MKTKSNTLWIIMIIITTIMFSSCTYYYNGQKISGNMTENAEWKWHKELPDTTKENIKSFFTIMGAGQNMTDSLLQHMRTLKILSVPDSLNADLKLMYIAYCFSPKKSELIIAHVSEILDGPSLLHDRVASYKLTVIETSSLRLAEVTTNEIHLIPIVWQIIFACVALFLAYMYKKIDSLAGLIFGMMILAFSCIILGMIASILVSILVMTATLVLLFRKQKT